MFVEGPDGNRIDCMFFPCTSKEEITIYGDNGEVKRRVGSEYQDPDLTSMGSIVDETAHNSINSAGQEREERLLAGYMTKPTIIMCNPNALFY